MSGIMNMLAPMGMMKGMQQATGNDPLIENPFSMAGLSNAIGLPTLDDYQNVQLKGEDRAPWQSLGAFLGGGLGKGVGGMGGGMPTWWMPLAFHNAFGTMYDLFTANEQGAPFEALLGEFFNQDPGGSLGSALRWGGRQGDLHA